MNSILHPYEMRTTYDQVHYLIGVGLLLLFDLSLLERILFEYHLNYHEYLSIWMLLSFLDQPIKWLQLSISLMSFR